MFMFNCNKLIIKVIVFWIFLYVYIYMEYIDNSIFFKEFYLKKNLKKSYIRIVVYVSDVFNGFFVCEKRR